MANTCQSPLTYLASSQLKYFQSRLLMVGVYRLIMYSVFTNVCSASIAEILLPFSAVSRYINAIRIYIQLSLKRFITAETEQALTHLCKRQLEARAISFVAIMRPSRRGHGPFFLFFAMLRLSITDFHRSSLLRVPALHRSTSPLQLLLSSFAFYSAKKSLCIHICCV